MAALKASLDLFHETGMEVLRGKSEQLTGLLFDLLTADGALPVQVITPADPGQRGCQLSLRVPGGAGRLVKELARRGIVCDAREPDILRVAPTPFYNRFHEVWQLHQALREILEG
jgi:kynureninase